MKLDDVLGMVIDRIYENDTEMWFHMRDGTAIEISADDDGGFSVYIHKADEFPAFESEVIH